MTIAALLLKATMVMAIALLAMWGARGSRAAVRHLILATAFAVYVTNTGLAGGTYAASYGFIVNATGTGSATYNVSSNGAALSSRRSTSTGSRTWTGRRACAPRTTDSEARASSSSGRRGGAR